MTAQEFINSNLKNLKTLASYEQAHHQDEHALYWHPSMRWAISITNEGIIHVLDDEGMSLGVYDSVQDANYSIHKELAYLNS